MIPGAETKNFIAHSPASTNHVCIRFLPSKSYRATWRGPLGAAASEEQEKGKLPLWQKAISKLFVLEIVLHFSRLLDAHTSLRNTPGSVVRTLYSWHAQ